MYLVDDFDFYQNNLLSLVVWAETTYVSYPGFHSSSSAALSAPKENTARDELSKPTWHHVISLLVTLADLPAISATPTVHI